MTKTIWGIIIAVVVILIIIWAVSVYGGPGMNDVLSEGQEGVQTEGENEQGENRSAQDEEALMAGEEVAFTGSVSRIFTGENTDMATEISNGLTVETEDGEEVFVSTNADTAVKAQDGRTVEISTLSQGAEVTVRGKVTSLGDSQSNSTDTEGSANQGGEGSNGFFDFGGDGSRSLDQATVLASEIQVTQSSEASL